MPAGAHRNQQKKIDSKNIATTFRKGNAITKLLTEAIQKENAGKTGVYYWKKTEARDLFESAGVQFPGGSMQDGLIRSILKNDSPVNRKFVEQTETTQFKRWFGKSKVVDRDGEPLVVYHATDAEFTVFDRDKLGERTKQRDIEDFNRNMEDSVGLLRSAELGFWFSEKNLAEDEYGGRHVLKLEDGKRIGMPVYLSIENPNYVDTYDLMETLDNMTVEEYLQEMEDYGYDGLIVTDQEFDNATSYVVFKPNQIKSATDNVGTFADICYFVSLRCNGLQAAQQHPKHHRLSMPCANCGGAERR